MSSGQCLRQLLVFLSLLLAIIFSASTNPQGVTAADKHTGVELTSGITNDELSASTPQDVSAISALLPSSALLFNVTTTISQDSTSDRTANATILPSSTMDGFTTTEMSPSSNQDNHTTTSVTFFPNTTDLAQTTGLTTPSSLSTNQSQPASASASTSSSTSHGAQTTVTATSVANISTTATSPDGTITNSTTQVQGKPQKLSYSEKAMTIFFSVLLGVAVFAVAVYSFTRCQKQRTQFTHRPLYNNSEEPVDRFVASDDTLVISGGLYDGPQIFHPATMTDEDVGFHSDRLPFTSGPTQFRLEFLPEEQEKTPDCMASTFETFQPLDDESLTTQLR